MNVLSELFRQYIAGDTGYKFGLGLSSIILETPGYLKEVFKIPAGTSISSKFSTRNRFDLVLYLSEILVIQNGRLFESCMQFEKTFFCCRIAADRHTGGICLR